MPADTNDLIAPMKDPRIFTGRRKEMIKLLRAVQKPTQHAVIYGARGVGKTSLAAQVQTLIDGDRTLLSKHGIEEVWRMRDGMTAVFHYTCEKSDSAKTLPQVLEAVVAGALEVWSIQFSSLGISENEEHEEGLEQIAVLKKTRGYRHPHGSEIDKFFLLMQRAAKHLRRERLVIILDEADRLNAQIDLGQLLRKAPPGITVIVVGIADTLEELITTKLPSVERQIARGTVPLGPLPDEEIAELVSACFLNNSLIDGVSIDVISYLVTLSCGLPWMTTLMVDLITDIVEEEYWQPGGQWRLEHVKGLFREAVDVDVQPRHYEAAIRRVLEGEELDFLQNRVHRVTDGDPSKESLLKWFAAQPQEQANWDVLVAEARAAGFEDAGNLLEQILRDGRVLLMTGDGELVFHDLMCRGYLRISELHDEQGRLVSGE